MQAAADGLTYEKASKYRSISNYAAAVMLVIVSVMQLISIGSAPSLRVFIMTGYFILLGVIIVLVEMEKGDMNQWFLFLNFGWGKVYLNMFLIVSMLSFPDVSVVQWIIAVAFLISSGLNLHIGRKF